MRTIFKYPLDITDVQTVALPVGADSLSVHMQGAHPCLWALVDTTAPTSQRVIRTYGTGHDCSDMAATAQFLGTVMLNGPGLVFHIFID
jgi:hypothetical protein